MPAPAKVRCREITATDLGAVSELLARGFPGRAHDYWMRGLRRQSERSVPEGYPRYGYMLESASAPVGVLLLIYASRIVNGDTAIRCNLSSWYVEPGFRNYATLLTSLAQKNKHVTYFNVTPAPPTWPIIEAQGFRSYCSGLFVCAPLLSSTAPGVTVETVTPSTSIVAGLSEFESQLLTSHARYGCTSLVCRDGLNARPFILMPLRIRRGRIPLPAMQLIYSRDTGDFIRCAGNIGRALVWQGKPLVAVNANGPIPGLIGRYTEARGRKYFKGPHPPGVTDLTDTELVLYGP